MDEPDKPRDSDDEWRIGQYAVRQRFVDGPLWVAHTAIRQSANGEERASIWMINPSLELVRGRTNQLVRQLSGLSGHNRPGVVNVIAIGATRTGPYVITGDADGETLAERLLEASYPAAEVVRIVLSVAGILGEAYTQSTAVHGALEPSRILVSDRSPRVRLRELGWLEAVRLSGVVAHEAIAAAIPQGAAPELQGRSGTIGPATDQYALASIAFEILTGRRPADDHSARGLPNERVTTHRPDLPLMVDTVLQTAWATEATDRYRSVLDFANAFRLAMLGSGVQDPASKASLWPRSASQSTPPTPPTARSTQRPTPLRNETPPDRSYLDARADRDDDEPVIPPVPVRATFRPPGVPDIRVLTDQPAADATPSSRPAAIAEREPNPPLSRSIDDIVRGKVTPAGGFEVTVPKHVDAVVPPSTNDASDRAEMRPTTLPRARWSMQETKRRAPRNRC